MKLKMLNTANPRGLVMADTLKRRYTPKADNGRTLALDSAAWRKLRASVLAGEPLCRHCTARGLTVIATDVDHLHGAADNRFDSLQPLCHECHSRKTARDMGGNVRLGCDTSGMPLDVSHHWHTPNLSRSDAF